MSVNPRLENFWRIKLVSTRYGHFPFYGLPPPAATILYMHCKYIDVISRSVQQPDLPLPASPRRPYYPAMPIYEYISTHPDDPAQSCPICRKGFELRREISRENLVRCPLCRNEVKKVISRVNTPKIVKSDTITEAKAAGFTVLEKKDNGVYEKR